MYKNWKEINKVTDVHFMRALALLDLDSPLGRTVVVALPQFFCEERTDGPVPLSVLRLKASTTMAMEDNGHSEEDLISQGAIPDEWPVFRFGDEDSVRAYGFEPVPEALIPANEVGKIYRWDDKDLVLVERGLVDGDEWFFVPAELIAVDK